MNEEVHLTNYKNTQKKMKKMKKENKKETFRL